MTKPEQPHHPEDHELRPREGVDTHDRAKAMTAFLQVFRADADPRTFDAEFEDSFFGEYPSLRAALDEHINGLGWRAALTQLRQEQGIADHDLRWNYESLEIQFREIFDIVHHADRVYVFHK
ncbi:hypothetical protein [Rathayibacter tritici]|uniref:hypothetical protein n=1 Tax=Rathayibacter tritici TaxID=33888 RepID=UPI000A7424E4|nr:hypothetical protein [Rathayibacter tritici]